MEIDPWDELDKTCAGPRLLSVPFGLAIAMQILGRCLPVYSFLHQASLLSPLGFCFALLTYVDIWMSKGVTIPWANPRLTGWKLVDKYFSLWSQSWRVAMQSVWLLRGSQMGFSPQGGSSVATLRMAVCPSLVHWAQSPLPSLWIDSQNSYTRACPCLRPLHFGGL